MDKGIPIKEAMELYPEVKEMMGKLERGEISMCACMGPIGDDPHCPCTMSQMGLVPTNPWTPEKIAELDRVLSEMYPPESGIKSTA